MAGMEGQGQGDKPVFVMDMDTEGLGAEDMEHGDDCDSFEDMAISSSDIKETQFDITIGHIEDIIMDEKFQEIQNNFMEKYWEEFEDTEENKFVYTDIHKEYSELVEKHLNDELCACMPGFSMEEFQRQLIDRKEELEGEVFETLLTFSDFLAFKE